MRQKEGNPDWYILGAVVVEEVVIIIIKIKLRVFQGITEPYV